MASDLDFEVLVSNGFLADFANMRGPVPQQSVSWSPRSQETELIVMVILLGFSLYLRTEQTISIISFLILSAPCIALT